MFNSLARSDGKEEGSRLENSAQTCRQRRGPRGLKHHHKPTCRQPVMVGSELPEERCLGTCSSEDCLKLMSEQPGQFYKLTGPSPSDFYIFPALLSNQLLGDSSAIGTPDFVSTSHSISSHINPLPSGSQPDLNNNTAASLPGDFFVSWEDLSASNISLCRYQLH